MHMSVSTHFFHLWIQTFISKANLRKLEVSFFCNLNCNCNFVNGPFKVMLLHCTSHMLHVWWHDVLFLGFSVVNVLMVAQLC